MKTKKFVAFMLSLAMIVGSIPALVLAEEAEGGEPEDMAEVSDTAAENDGDEEEPEAEEEAEAPVYNDPDNYTTGKCGDDANYIRYDDGTVYIEGPERSIIHGAPALLLLRSDRVLQDFLTLHS